MTAEIYQQIEAYMLSCMSDSAHDKEHVYRVLYNALAIAQPRQDVDTDILIAACLLHDIGQPDQLKDPDLCHAEVGAEKAFRFLLEQGFGEDFAGQVRHCIQTHRFRRNDPPQTIEAKILFDADKLDVTGAIGVARTLVYRGAVTEPLYTRLPDGTISDGTEDDAPSFLREYKFKLEKLYDRFYTAQGANMAKERQAIAKAFYESLYREVSHSCARGKACLEALITD